MSTELPGTVELARARNGGLPLRGPLSTGGMKRLREAGEPAATVSVDALLAADEQGETLLTGSVESSIRMQCQRCLEPVDMPLTGTLDLVILDTRDAMHGEDESAEVLVVDDAVVRLQQVIEDELLLSLPVVARHDFACRPESSHFGPADEPEPESDNPFAALKELRTRRDDE